MQKPGMSETKDVGILVLLCFLRVRRHFSSDSYLKENPTDFPEENKMITWGVEKKNASTFSWCNGRRFKGGITKIKYNNRGRINLKIFQFHKRGKPQKAYPHNAERAMFLASRRTLPDYDVTVKLWFFTLLFVFVRIITVTLFCNTTSSVTTDDFITCNKNQLTTVTEPLKELRE